MATLTTQDLKLLETTRQRFSQLTSQLATLQHQLINGEGDPLPKWTSLHNQSLILSQTLATLASHLESNNAFFDSAAVFPLPSFPGREQTQLLQALLENKLAPPVAEWVDEGRAAGEAVVGQAASHQYGEWKRLWEWAAVEANDFARSHDWGAEDEEDESDEDEEGKGKGEVEDNMEVDVHGITNFDPKARPLEADQWIQFMSKGFYERRR